MNIALVYSSITGNTEELINILKGLFRFYNVESTAIRVDDFPLEKLARYDAIVIGTYTWGDGDIPDEMRSLYNAFEDQDVRNVVTGVVGTGDQFYPNFCGAVDEFRDMLYVHTQLAVTLKIELTPQLQDLKRCRKFVDSLIKRLSTVEIK
ncbi:flavodoxin domain-containing protein [Neobacillus ginsengisoli]|uniref:Flavodoxin I n=1 Tax=Neobacillus ginsengisoli TaxID=904295 RepID=A0ABT9Y2X3_9BACI|nr:flavodoxin domain-containing protein [Neobacillus ginsengisoli]MDQ0201552.1 flavodoxin I [Neobacillus ginsengisoli]